MKRWFAVAAILAVLFLPFQARAGEKSPISVDATDSPLVIRGTLETTPILSGSLRLTASEDVAAFNFYPSDLTPAGGGDKLPRQNVSLTGQKSLSANTPVDYVVNISGIQKPGTYEGTLTFLLPGQPLGDGLSVPIKVEALSKAVLAPLAGSEQLQLGLVKCTWDCWLVGKILPDSALINTRQIMLENKGKGDTTLTETGMVVMGQKTGYQLTARELSVTNTGDEARLPAGKISEINVAITRANIPPDHYTGTLYLVMDGVDERVRIPVDINMRIGPGLPIVLLLLGIILGRLFKFMQEKGGPQADALVKVYEVTSLIEKNAAPEDQPALKAMLQAIRDRVVREKLDQVDADLKALETRIEALRQLRQVEAFFKGKDQHPTVKEVLNLIAEARQLFYQGIDKEANDKMTAALQKAEPLKKTLMGSDGKPDPNAARAVENLQAAVAAGAAQGNGAPGSREKPEPWLKKAGHTILRFLSWIAGVSYEVRAGIILLIVRPLLALLLLVGLVYLGLNSFYVTNGATFGSSPLSDYVGVVLWGLSADVAGRTLGSLGK